MHDYSESNARGSTFWMTLEDFCKYFYVMTISFARNKYKQSFLSDQVFSYHWGACEINMPTAQRDVFYSMYQLNDRFMNDYVLGDEDYQFAEMQLIVTKVIKIPPKTGANNTTSITGECAYIDGVTNDVYNSCSLKIDRMTAGQYILFYKAKFNES